MNNNDHEYQPETNYEYQVRMTDEARKAAYADPQNGSDRLFAEAARLDAVGDTGGAEAARANGLARYEAIRTQHPWPNNE